MTEPALALLEFNSIASGIQAADTMVKRAPVERIYTGTVQPGHYLVMVTGDVASVEEAVTVGRQTAKTALRDLLFLPNVHPDVVAVLAGSRPAEVDDALGVVETKTVAAAIRAADAGLKGAEVRLLLLRLADGLGGKGLALFSGLVADVEAAVDIGAAASQSELLQQIVIPKLHDDMWPNVRGNGRFGTHFNWEAF